MAERKIRWQPGGTAGPWRPLVAVDSGAWMMVRRADVRGAAPFVISRKEWDKLEQRDG